METNGAIPVPVAIQTEGPPRRGTRRRRPRQEDVPRGRAARAGGEQALGNEVVEDLDEGSPAAACDAVEAGGERGIQGERNCLSGNEILTAGEREPVDARGDLLVAGNLGPVQSRRAMIRARTAAAHHREFNQNTARNACRPRCRVRMFRYTLWPGDEKGPVKKNGSKGNGAGASGTSSESAPGASSPSGAAPSDPAPPSAASPTSASEQPPPTRAGASTCCGPGAASRGSIRAPTAAVPLHLQVRPHP